MFCELFPNYIIFYGLPLLALIYCLFRKQLIFSLHGKELEGPFAWPILGNILSIDEKKPYKKLTEWSKQYGRIYRIYLGSKMAIVLNDINIIKEAFAGKNGNTFSGRPALNNTDLISSRLGLVNSEGQLWKQQRKFSTRCFRELGAGRSGMEQKIEAELQRMLAAISNDVNIDYSEPVDICYYVRFCVANVILTLILSQRYDYDDSWFAGMQQRVSEMMKIEGSTTLANYLPWLAKLYPDGRGIPALSKHIEVLDEFFESEVEKRLLSIENNNHCPSAEPDYLDVFIDQMLKQQQNESCVDNGFHKAQAKQAIMDLFIAGIEDTTQILSWSLLFMVLNPEVQAKVQAEIDENLGQSPRWEDRNTLSITVAVMTECMRLANTEPTAALHSTTEDTQLLGYRIPKHAIVIPNCWAVHMDPTSFPDPTLFRYERFLDEIETTVTGTETIVPFCVGQRRCLGENIARMLTFMIFTSILDNFSLSVLDTEPQPKTEPVGGLILAPEPYRVILKQRRPFTSTVTHC